MIVLILLTIVICVILASAMYIRRPDHPAHHSMSVLCGCFALWTGANWLAIHPSTPEVQFFWVQTVMCVTIPIPWLFLHFSLHFVPLQSSWMVKLKKMLPLSLLWTGLLMMSAYTPLMFRGYSFTDHWVALTPGVAAFLYGVTFCVHAVLGLTVLLSIYHQQKGLIRLQLAYIFLGLSLTVGIGFTTNFLFVVLLQNFKFLTIGPLSSLFFLSGVTYAMIKHRLLDLRLVVLRAVAYVLAVMVVAGGLAAAWVLAVDVIAGYWFEEVTNWHVFGIVIVTAIIFPRVLVILEQVLQKVFYASGFQLEHVYQDLAKITAEQDEVRDIIHQVSLCFSQHLNASCCDIFLKKNVISDVLEKTWKELGKPSLIVFDELPDGNHKELLRTHQLTLVIPLQLRQQLLGWVGLSHKRSGNAFSLSELQFCQVAAPQISLALYHAQSRRAMRQFTRQLEREVQSATSELRQANTQLAQLDQLKDEFVSIASHELRTPMTAIRSYLWLCLFRTKEQLPPTVQQHLQIAYTATERLLILVKDLLTVSQLEAGQLPLQRQRTNFKELLELILSELEVSAQEKNLKMLVKYTPSFLEFPGQIYIDHIKVTEILQNLLGNAIKFSPPADKILIKVSLKGSSLCVAVRDHGPGIVPEQQKLLFQKFGIQQQQFRTSPSQGTGLGLYIAQQFAELHGGVITLRSQLRKGTVFTAHLPIGEHIS